MPKPEKIKAVENIRKYLEESDSIFVTDYSGLNVADITVLRKNLRENSVRYLVAKNTLMRIAAKDAGHDGITEYLEGPTALAFGKEDPALLAKILYDSYKEKEKPVVKAFVVENQLFPGSEVVRLAELPSKEVLLAHLVFSIESPLSSVVSSLDGVFQELLATLEALAKSKE
jgi:large subunit ribosomal protein L10